MALEVEKRYFLIDEATKSLNTENSSRCNSRLPYWSSVTNPNKTIYFYFFRVVGVDTRSFDTQKIHLIYPFSLAFGKLVKQEAVPT